MDDSAPHMEEWKRTVWNNENDYRNHTCERIKRVEKSVDLCSHSALEAGCASKRHDTKLEE